MKGEEGTGKALLGSISVFLTPAIIRLLSLLNTSEGNRDMNKHGRLRFYQTNRTKKDKARSEILVYFGFLQKGTAEELKKSLSRAFLALYNSFQGNTAR